jgi:prephenate dehydratase
MIITLGPEGSFSYEVCKTKYAIQEIAYKNSLEEVFADTADLALVPLWNTVSGGVVETLNHLKEFEIIEEIPYRIRYHLVGAKKAKKLIVQKYCYQQCRKSLERLLGDVLVEFTDSNGLSFKRFLEEKDAMAVVPQHVAEKYSLEILERDVQDDPRNETLFVLLRKRGVAHNSPKGIDDEKE